MLQVPSSFQVPPSSLLNLEELGKNLELGELGRFLPYPKITILNLKKVKLDFFKYISENNYRGSLSNQINFQR